MCRIQTRGQQECQVTSQCVSVYYQIRAACRTQGPILNLKCSRPYSVHLGIFRYLTI